MKDNVCYRFSRQVYSWKVPLINSPLNVWGIEIWQQTIFTEVTVKTLWSIKSRGSAVCLEINLGGNRRKPTLVRIPSKSKNFSNVLVWATRRRAMERSWHPQSIYPNMAARRYLPESRHLSKLTMCNQKADFTTCVAQNILYVVTWITELFF